MNNVCLEKYRDTKSTTGAREINYKKSVSSWVTLNVNTYRLTLRVATALSTESGNLQTLTGM